MNYRSLTILVAVVLLVLTVTTIDTPQVVWNPVRLGLGGAGVLLALGVLLADRKARNGSDWSRPRT